MAHKEQWIFCNNVKSKFPDKFNNKKVLDIGSFDVNGNESFLFNNCDFNGLDLSEGPGVNIVCPAQDYDAPDESYDTIISCECWEHNPFYRKSIQNCVRLLKSGGLFLFTCATTGRPIHGVKSLESESKLNHKQWKTMPNVLKEDWDNEYYKNLTEEDIMECVDFDQFFSEYQFEIEKSHCDLYFWGIKK